MVIIGPVIWTNQGLTFMHVETILYITINNLSRRGLYGKY